MASTDMDDNKITARDTGVLLEKLYNRKIASEALTRELLDFMKDTDFEDRLPLYISNKATVYHKTGDAVRMVHDAGIIVDSNSTFILSVLSSDVQDEKAVKEEMGKIAEIAYQES
jgi:beta-lactamase class A